MKRDLPLYNLMCSATPATETRAGSRLRTVCSLLGLACMASAVALVCRAAPVFRGSPLAATAAQTSSPSLAVVASADSAAPLRHVARPARRLGAVAIKNIRLGQRVVGKNPQRRGIDETAPEPVEETWRELHLEAVDADKNLHQIHLLRPAEWIAAHHAAVGRTFRLTLPEMGVDGDAKVVSIGPCPKLEKDRGDGSNIVTGKFIHTARGADLVALALHGTSQVTNVTKNHRYWSADRKKFVRAEDLRPGERIDNALGSATTVASVGPSNLADTTVYNLEVYREHVYRVGDVGALVHNAYNCFPPGTQVLMADGSTRAIERIDAGSWVMAADPTDGEHPIPYRVTARLENFTLRLIRVAFDKNGDGAADGNVRATGEHPFWTEAGWKPARLLQRGDVLRSATGKSIAVVNATEERVVSKTYNLSVDGVHTYFVVAAGASILVHNVDPWDIQFSRPVNPGETFAHGPWAGRTVEEAIDAARSMGRLPEGLELNAGLVNDRWVAANNRTLYVAQQANLSQVHPVTSPAADRAIQTHFKTNGVGGPIDPCP